MKDIRPAARHRNRGPGRLAGLLMALLVVLGLAGSTAIAAPGGTAQQARVTVKVPARALDAVAAMQPSWNLGNTLDAIPDETSWGNPKATRELFKTIRAEGFRSVRIPVSWHDHQSTTAPYSVDAAYMSRVKDVVDWALAENLYVVLNVHHDSWQWIEKIATDHDNVVARFDALWTQISATFRNEPRTLLFEGVNEPNFSNATAAQKTQFMDELNTSFQKVVRASGGGNKTRLLVLTTQVGTPSQDLMDDLYATITALRDSNLVATVHYYSYFPFSVNIAGGTRYDDNARNDAEDVFARIHHTFVARGIPVYLGEYGLLAYPDDNHPSRIERGEALKYYEHVGHLARAAGATTALWDPGFAYLNRATLKWRDPALFAWIKSSWTTRSGTASFDRVYLAKSSRITPQSLTLNPNGTKFRGLWHGDTKLAEGRDYTVFENRLTLTAPALTRLAGDRAHGVDATLQARFSKGLPWQIDVVTYDTPVLSDATGTAEQFAVPTKYLGDDLATMESTYSDGTNAGQTGWTPYQEFNQSFRPDFRNGTIILTTAYLKALRDGDPATLTFHFHSGAKVKYKVTKSGDSVTGTAVKES
ncbi:MULTISPECIES: cellulase family glycosylhydrolase [unclassified Streptomyces]|uniref:cellulase family glycosylhydrolase n=1 Tax=unclassified Streptomyces TaxID=2593676 RepID=UPI0016550431|nr:cellulase family glycosylhydrolase [Streptomyces sp. CB02980]MCB8901287.1 cellulase family glycosylhydrolase [Streptomyces sp. CB02980]